MVPAPRSEAELAARAHALAGVTLGELAASLGVRLPVDLRGHKGFVGELVEAALGADAGSRPVPDFEALGVELKTVPLGANQRPRESTHVCTVSLGELLGQQWADSSVRRKLARVLWVPVEATPSLPLAARRIGAARLWSPTVEDERMLAADWEEHMELLATGRFDAIDGRLGSCLQLRPKAANGAARVAASDADGQPAATLPRGFYLRATFTARILASPPQ
ncbi:MAG: DNA mismatch repair endonuclease MutH [Gammaproteobacteria bacterium]